MSMMFPSLVQETTSITGTGDYILDGAVPGYRSVGARLSAGDTATFVIKASPSWELIKGTYRTGPNRVERTQVYYSSGGAATPISWSSGDKAIYIDILGMTDLDAAGLADLQAALGISTFIQGLLDDANAAAALATLTAAALGANADITSMSALQGINTGPLAGFRSLLINGDGRFNQRGSGAGIADDTYGLDRWNVLTQTAAVTVSTLTDVENGTPFMWRLTQQQVSSQRMGHSQIIESVNCKHLRGKQVTFSGRFRCSAAQAIRFAVIEWTGTADAVTSDIVNNWTSGTFTAGNFFTTTSMTISGVTAVTPSAATLTDFSLTVTLGSSFNNIIVFMWTEAVGATNLTLDGACQLEVGAVASRREFRPQTTEFQFCQRYYFKDTVSYIAAADITGSSTERIFWFRWPVTMWSSPSVSFSGPSSWSVTPVTAQANASGFTIQQAATGASTVAVVGPVTGVVEL